MKILHLLTALVVSLCALPTLAAAGASDTSAGLTAHTYHVQHATIDLAGLAVVESQVTAAVDLASKRDAARADYHLLEVLEAPSAMARSGSALDILLAREVGGWPSWSD